MTTKKFETLHTLPQKIEVKEVLGSPFVRPPTFMGYASSNLGQMRELWFKWGTRWELGEHNWKVVGTCWEMHHGEHGANIFKIQKNLNFGPPLTNPQRENNNNNDNNNNSNNGPSWGAC